MLKREKLIERMGGGHRSSVYVGIGSAVGIVAGAVLGSRFGNVGLGVGLGICFGVALAAVVSHELRRRDTSGGDKSSHR